MCKYKQNFPNTTAFLVNITILHNFSENIEEGMAFESTN
jgi:hypothetical protein